jgi:hypothetical protein
MELDVGMGRVELEEWKIRASPPKAVGLLRVPSSCTAFASPLAGRKGIARAIWRAESKHGSFMRMEIVLAGFLLLHIEREHLHRWMTRQLS